MCWQTRSRSTSHKSVVLADASDVLRWYGIDLPRLDDCAACGEKFLVSEGADLFA
jgi:hypothetical protein